MHNQYVVFYSGGISSFCATTRLLRSGIDKKYITLLFTDTKTEDEDLYRFLIETSNFLDIPLTWLADGRNIWQVMHDKKYLANDRVDHCSSELKRKIAKKYVKAHFPVPTTTLVFGIDWSESERVEPICKNWKPYDVIFPLCDKPYKTYQSYFNEVESYKIPVPRLYKLGFTHNNCGGFCVKAGKKHFKNLLETMPERYAYHEQKEQELLNVIGHKYGILAHTRNKKRQYITLKQYREMVTEIDPEEIDSDLGHCNCFIERSL